MKILKPFKNFTLANISQGYHDKHKAIDVFPARKIGFGAYGTPLVAPEKCTIGKIYGNNYTPDDLAPVKNGFGLFMKGVSGYEHLYWHTQPFMPVSTGDVVEKGTIVAYCGNSGNVYSGTRYIPIEERNVPNFAGTHLHQTISKIGVGELLNPLDFIDLVEEPKYTIADELKATSKTLLKMLNVLK